MADHHKETFLTKYVFSQDHKMIAKQFLITGMFMALLGMAMSALFRVQLANPGKAYPILGDIFLWKMGSWWSIRPKLLSCISNNAWNDTRFLGFNWRIIRNFC